jgi:predicted pyridoxine 5'-phosphate oxidase superfamily flavin-nucleotide-binding protein
MLAKRISELLQDREFVSVGTCSLASRPNVAPKFFLKIEEKYIYLIDYVIGTTHKNLLENPRVSLSVFDFSELIGYQINGTVELIDSGDEYEQIIKELLKKEIDLSAKRIIEGLGKGIGHKSFELGLSDQFVIIKMKIEETVEIGPTGVLRREMI